MSIELDQVTKRWVQRSIGVRESRTIIDGLLSLTHGRNPGIAFGVLSEGSLPYQALALTLLGLVAVAAFLVAAVVVSRLRQEPAVVTTRVPCQSTDRESLQPVIWL